MPIINSTKEITAKDLGLTATEIDKVDKKVIVKVYKEDDAKPISEKAIYTKDMAAATLSSAVAVEAGAAVPAVKAKFNVGTNADIEVNVAGKAGNDYEIRIVEDNLLPSDTAKVVVSGKVVLITYYGNVAVEDLNDIAEFNGLFTATGSAIDSVNLSAKAGKASNGADAVAATGPVLTLTFDKAMTEAKTVKMTVNGKEVKGNVEWITNKEAKVTFASNAENLAEVTKGNNITALDLVTVNGVKFGTLNKAITN